MFKLSQSDSFFWPVSVNVPADGGKFEKQTFDAQFKRISQSRLHELQDAGREGKITDAELVKEIVVGWKGIEQDGEPVAFSATNLDSLLEIPAVAGAIIQAFVDSVSGLVRKN